MSRQRQSCIRDRFLTEFQVVTSPDGRILHCIGLLVDGDQALLHSEALPTHPTVEPDACRSALWRRLRILARNQGISRIWTREDAEFWVISGYESIPESRLPAELPSFVPKEEGWRVYHMPKPTEADLRVKREPDIWQTKPTMDTDLSQQRGKGI